jgi:putative oxidoreductase
VDRFSAADYGIVVARLCLTVVFLWSGITKLLDPVAARKEVAELGIPAPSFGLALTILCQIIGGLMVLLGFWARLGALALLAFVVVATLLAHRFQGQTGAERQRELTTSLEHLAIVGGLMMVVICGAGRLSLDRFF